MNLVGKIVSLAKKNKSVSYGHKLIPKSELRSRLKQYQIAWKNPLIPERQLKIVNNLASDFKNNPPVKVLLKALKNIPDNNKKLLEIGCSSGYYSEYISKSGFKFKYEGCDYSQTFIDLAKKRYPDIKFSLNDSTKLTYKDESFDVVISGSCILHIPNYRKAISETCRVSKKYVIFHRTPILHLTGTTFTSKQGYNVEMLEIIFNESELLNEFRKNKLVVTSIFTVIKSSIALFDEPVFVKDYVCQKE